MTRAASLVVSTALLTLLTASCVSADSEAARLAKENSDRTRHFHELNDKVTQAQLVLQDWLTGEVKKCEARGQLHPPAKGNHMVLKFTQIADLACVEDPDPAQQPQKPGTTVVPPPPANPPTTVPPVTPPAPPAAVPAKKVP